MTFLYQLALYLSYLIISILAIFNKKIDLWWKYSNNWKNQFKDKNIKNAIWFHVASVGEFEMAIPLIKQIKINRPTQKIVISFFSVSGIKFYPTHELVDCIFLYPKDYKKNINYILDFIQPTCLIIVKNERWLNMIQQTYLKNIPIYQVEVEEKKYSFIYQKYIDYVQKFIMKVFYVKDGSLQIERVKSIENILLPKIQDFASNHFTIILGSCYMEEAKLISSFYANQKDLKIILCPHEIDKQTFHQYLFLFKEKISKYSDTTIDSNILFIDKMGILKHIYQYSNIAFIGGGFNYQLHNIFEAATHHNIIITGNKLNENYLNTLADNAQLIHKVEDLKSLEFIINQSLNSSYFSTKNKEKWCNFFKLHQNTAQSITDNILADL